MWLPWVNDLLRTGWIPFPRDASPTFSGNDSSFLETEPIFWPREPHQGSAISHGETIMRYTTLAVFAAALTLLAACGGEETTSAPEPTSPPIVQPDDNTKPDDTTPPNEHPDAGSDQQPDTAPPNEAADRCIQVGGATFDMPSGPCLDDRGGIVPLDEDLRHLLAAIPGRWRDPDTQNTGDVERITDGNGDRFNGFPSGIVFVDVANIRPDGCFVQVLDEAFQTIHGCFGYDHQVFVLDFNDGRLDQTEFMGRDALTARLVYDGPTPN